VAPRRRFPAAPACGAVLLAVTVLAGWASPAAGAEETTTTTPTAPASTPATTVPSTAVQPGPTSPAPPQGSPPDGEAFRQLADQVTRNTTLIAQLTRQVDAATARIAELTASITQTQAELDATKAEMADLRKIVRSRAAFMYQRSHDPALSVSKVLHVEDLASARQYAESAMSTDMGAINQLEDTADKLEATRQALETQRQEKQVEKDRLERSRQGLIAVTARQQKLLNQIGAIPVMGPAELSPDEVVAWFNSRRVRVRLSGGTSIGDLVALYYEEGAAENVRPELAFAQSIIETGSFGNATDNNYAGIGACDSCVGEPAFPTPRDGVRGQVQFLRNYADPASRAANLANPPSPTIWGNNPFTAAHGYDTFFDKGQVPTWNLMGNGNWATAPHYANAVLTTYFEMVSFASR
jgi:hypothetical protein